MRYLQCIFCSDFSNQENRKFLKIEARGSKKSKFSKIRLGCVIGWYRCCVYQILGSRTSPGQKLTRKTIFRAVVKGPVPDGSNMPKKRDPFFLGSEIFNWQDHPSEVLRNGFRPAETRSSDILEQKNGAEHPTAPSRLRDRSTYRFSGSSILRKIRGSIRHRSFKWVACKIPDSGLLKWVGYLSG